MNAGWYGKLHDWTDMWLKVLPEGIEIQHPDIQSAFNTAHLVRGNDIFMDFYDNPDALNALLDNLHVARNGKFAGLIENLLNERAKILKIR